MIKVVELSSGEREQFYKFVREHAYSDDKPDGYSFLQWYMSLYHPEIKQTKIGDY